jgi:hypothetical protein
MLKTKDLWVKILKTKDLALARAKAEKHFIYGMTNKGYQADSALERQTKVRNRRSLNAS